MKKIEDQAVQKFLDEIQLLDNEKYKSLIEIRKIIYDVHPETQEKLMYGGIVFFYNNEMFSGIFASKKHVTLEFSNGYLMKDPNNQLEGTGKYRRHLKIIKKEDISVKETAYFVKQSVEDIEK